MLVFAVGWMLMLMMKKMSIVVEDEAVFMSFSGLLFIPLHEAIVTPNQTILAVLITIATPSSS